MCVEFVKGNQSGCIGGYPVTSVTSIASALLCVCVCAVFTWSNEWTMWPMEFLLSIVFLLG